MSDHDQFADQPLIAHLIELRDRLIRIVITVLIIFIGFMAFANELYVYLAEPLQTLMPEGSSMIATQVASPFLAPFKLALYLAVYCAAPVMLYQIWGFIAPGLYKNEKKLVAPLLLSSIFLFYAGMAFAYYIVFPLIFGFFTTVGPTGITVMTDIDAYLSFVLKLFLAFGLAFEIPIATMLLVKAGVADVKSLKSKRPYVFLGCFVAGMLVTPPDMISQTLLAVPMWLLFEAGLIGARFLGPPRGSDTVAEEAATDNTENAKTNGVDDSDSETHDIQEFDLYASITDPSAPQGSKDADTDVGPEPPKSGA